MEEEHADNLTKGECYDIETLYWAGYLYRYWHIYTGESSREILKQASAKTMRIVYLMYHTMSPEMAIDRLKESYLEKQKSNFVLCTLPTAGCIFFTQIHVDLPCVF